MADFGNKSPKHVIEDIVTQVIAVSKGDFSEQRYIRQLRILAQLRNLGTENLRIMDSITSFFRIEKDFLYMRGEKEGMEKAKEIVVKNLLRNTDFTIHKIANLSNTTIAFVKKVKKALN